MEILLNEHNLKITVVTFQADYFARRYVQETGISWPVLIDEDRELYKGYGMLSASFWDIWGPKTWWVYFRELMRGRKPKKSSGDIAQRGGDVLIDPEGIVRLHHVGSGPADRPSLEEILKVIHHCNEDILKK